VSVSRAVRLMVVPAWPRPIKANGWAAFAPIEYPPWCIPADMGETPTERAGRMLSEALSLPSGHG